jgi:hypothetical protein
MTSARFARVYGLGDAAGGDSILTNGVHPVFRKKNKRLRGVSLMCTAMEMPVTTSSAPRLVSVQF